MKSFVAPEFNLGSAWFADAALPLTLKLYQNIEDVIIQPQDKKMLREYRKQRLLFFTNHPSQAEPLIAYHVSKIMGSRFNYMATRRAFDFVFGLVGKLFQSVGVYSILPGLADRESMKMTRQILSQPHGKLVIFPEGEPMCGENDSLMPFQSGILKLGFAALQDARKKDPAADLIILPGFIRYVIKSSREEVMENLTHSIRRIERKLGASPGARNLLRQFLMVGRLLLEQAEERYDLDCPSDKVADFDFRIGRLRHRILDNVWRKLETANYDKDADAINKLRLLSAHIESLQVGVHAPGFRRVPLDVMQWAEKELVTAYDFITIRRDYLVSRPTPERFYEWLARFESIVLGKTPRALGGEPSPLPRKAYVFFSAAVHLGPYLAEYKQNKQQLTDRLMEKIRQDMQHNLDSTLELTYNLVPAGDIGDT
ncbi:MAG: 1-acyl-sn-glycerol-3-phosphate acyltransferase [Leptospiraceae bacterium]|nr:1-acyl-sn-glycerol-3-phosphate acyltransferase [Leptospiraceae bacterium]